MITFSHLQPNEYSAAQSLVGKSVILNRYSKEPIEGILVKNGHEPYNINGINFWPTETYHTIKCEGDKKEVIGGVINGREINTFCAGEI